jgi:hypothetical protein
MHAQSYWHDLQVGKSISHKNSTGLDYKNSIGIHALAQKQDLISLYLRAVSTQVTVLF